MNTVLKIGFGHIRLKPMSGVPKGFFTAVWLAWVLGYGWYLLLIYTVAVIPLLKGLVR